MDLYLASGAHEHRAHEHLVDAICAARAGLAFSPTNFQYKLLLLRLYRLSGAFDAMHELYLQVGCDDK
jgi:hypothetical protein